MSNIVDVIEIDGVYTAVPVEVTDWITSRIENPNEYEEVPDEVYALFNKELIQKNIEQAKKIGYKESSKTLLVTSGSGENDRAIHVSCYFDSFDSLKELNQYLKNNNLEIGEEFDYYSY